VFCVNCGKAYEPYYKFCNHCGYPLPPNLGQHEGANPPDPVVPIAVAPTDAPPEMQGEAPTLVPAPVVTIPAATNAPYATFVSLVLGSTLFASVDVFNVTDAYARNHWGATPSTALATLAAVLMARSAWLTWHRVVAVEPETDAELRRRHRRMLRNSAIIILLFFTISGTVGAAIGQNRAEAVQLAVDLARMDAVGDRISKARSAVEATIPSYVQMYKTIAPDVQELEPILRRLKTELALYDGKFPAQHEQTSKSIAGMDIGLQRMALLKQQIEVARQIEALDPNQQFAAWKTQMEPVLASEDALGKAK
jgi:hypothetical protein